MAKRTGTHITEHVLLAEVTTRIHRRYPDAVQAYLNHPGYGQPGEMALWDLASADGEMLWPDPDFKVFQGADEPGERLWLGDRDGDPYAELAEINRLLTAVYRERGTELFEPGSLSGGWELALLP